MVKLQGQEKAPCAVAVATYRPTYKPTYKPSLRGSGCADDADWLYDAGDKGLKGCDHVASEPDKVEKATLEARQRGRRPGA